MSFFHKKLITVLKKLFKILSSTVIYQCRRGHVTILIFGIAMQRYGFLTKKARETTKNLVLEGFF